MFFAPLPDLPDRPEVVRMHFTHRPCPFGPTPRTSSRLGDLNLLGQELQHRPGPVREVCAVNQDRADCDRIRSATGHSARLRQGFGSGGWAITVLSHCRGAEVSHALTDGALSLGDLAAGRAGSTSEGLGKRRQRLPRRTAQLADLAVKTPIAGGAVDCPSIIAAGAAPPCPCVNPQRFRSVPCFFRRCRSRRSRREPRCGTPG
jgi:hypothetical protein